MGGRPNLYTFFFGESFSFSNLTPTCKTTCSFFNSFGSECIRFYRCFLFLFLRSKTETPFHDDDDDDDDDGNGDDDDDDDGDGDGDDDDLSPLNNNKNSQLVSQPPWDNSSAHEP